MISRQPAGNGRGMTDYDENAADRQRPLLGDADDDPPGVVEEPDEDLQDGQDPDQNEP